MWDIHTHWHPHTHRGTLPTARVHWARKVRACAAAHHLEATYRSAADELISDGMLPVSWFEDRSKLLRMQTTYPAQMPVTSAVLPTEILAHADADPNSQTSTSNERSTHVRVEMLLSVAGLMVPTSELLYRLRSLHKQDA